MCGIAGAVHRDPNHCFDEATVIAMRDALAHRGPDDAGHYLAPGVALASRRLAILDLSARGHMPMSSADGRYLIVYNGEVYNFSELRATLEAKGQPFRSNTDTEVILYLYIHEGPAMLERLNGMFGIAIWDTRERTLFLARDRLGVKPVCYSVDNGLFRFASEAKALFAGGQRARFDPAVWPELLCFRYVAGEATPHEGVRRLLPGHYLIWKEGDVRIRRWWSLADRARTLRESPSDDPVGWYRETFDDAVRLRRISDVPVGVLLSGGLDSGTVAASLADQAGSGVASFTVRFAEAAYDEGPLAQEVAGHWNLCHHELTLNPEEVLGRLAAAAVLNDEPLTHASDLHLGAISQYAKPRVTVLLSGEGADETLGGYVRYQPLRHPALLNAARPLLPALVSAFRLKGRYRKLSRFLSLGALDRFVLYNACETLPDDLQSIGMSPIGRFPYREEVLAEAEGLYPGELMRQAMYSDQLTFLVSLLHRNDRMTMGASIECRVPFLDYRLVEGAAALPSSMLLSGNETKSLLRRSLGSRLPESVRNGRKVGFAVPWTRYLRETPGLRATVHDLADVEPITSGPFNRAKVRAVAEAFLSGDDGQQALVLQMVMTALWWRASFPNPQTHTPVPVGAGV